MRRLGRAVELGVQAEQDATGAVACVALIGPRGGYIGDALLDRGAAQAIVDALTRALAADTARLLAASAAELGVFGTPGTLPRTTACTACVAKAGDPMCGACGRYVRAARGIVRAWQARQ